jgi:hemolysin D
MPQLPSLFRRQPEEALAGPISAFESETQAVMQLAQPRNAHAVLQVIVAAIVSLLFVMGFSKLDRVVTSSGRIITTEGSLFVGPLDRAIVRDIDVTMGDIVTKGQVLAHLDPTFAATDLARYTEKLQSAQALVDRLEAERGGRPYNPVNGNPAEILQSSLWRQRQAEYQQNMVNLDAQINGAKTTLLSAQHDASVYAERLGHAQTIEKMRTTLEEHGYGSKLNTLLATDTRTDMGRMQAAAQATAQESKHTLEALTAQRGVFIEKWQDDIATNLVTAQNELDQTRGDLTQAQKIHDLITLTAPEDAIVLKIGQASAGSIVGESQEPLFTLVPLRGALEAEVEIDSKDIGFIQPGDTVRLKLEAYPFMRHGTMTGTIKTISEGSFVAGVNGESRSPYFKAKITLTDTVLRDVPKSFRLVPGMTLGGDVVVGHRTILSYLVEGGLRLGHEAMREP